ncbi:CHAP domain-containing protein [Sphingobacterium pedocola]|uniref:Peptidoglycan-binding protein n=1 Tax=Sphingobacterium pedocola TaxID=2082722 RepID=A0ABR9T8A3_9SPHI|nr:CHAP domain-containing protein [Sphingobacterium pedocola]MBE8721573.1 peptidoglycan-binding protein [Sphingobacterium pedocola]
MILLGTAFAQPSLSVDRLRLQATYQAELGHFDKKKVSAYLAYTGLDYGHEWCAAFVSYCFAQLGQTEPRTPWSPSLFPQRKQVWNNGVRATMPTVVLPGMVWGIHIASKGRVGHVGFVDSYAKGMLTTVEGNTSDPDRRQPNGVYRKRRSWRTIKSLSDWLQADPVSKLNKSNF